MRQTILLLTLAVLAQSQPASTAAQHSRLMMVVSKGLPGITIYDADTRQPICRATMGVSPHEAAFSLDGHVAYVPVYGSTGVGVVGTDEHTLHFISTDNCHEVGVLDTGENKRPHGIAVGASGAIYLTTEVSKSLLLIDPRERKIVSTIPTDSPYSHMIAVTGDEKKVYVSNVQSKTVSVLDVPGRKLAKVISTDGENQRMALSPDQQWFVTSLGPDHKIAFYRTVDNQLDFAVPVDGLPFVAKFSADGKSLFDAGAVNGQMKLWKIDVAGRRVTGSTSENLGTSTGSLSVSPFNGHLFVSDQVSNRISEIDSETLKVMRTISTDKTPDAILFHQVN